jgi:hypothetical protein
MKSLVEEVAIIALFILTPVIVARVLIGLARVIENMGELPIDESETLAVCDWAGSSEGDGA